MIDRVGSFSVSQVRVDPAGGGSERPSRAGEFQDMMRGAADPANVERANPDTAMPSPLRLSRLGGRTREAGQPPAAPNAAPGSTPTAVRDAPPHTRFTAVGAPGSSPTTNASEHPTGPTPASAAAAVAIPGTSFVRSTDPAKPHLPRFVEVPESAQYPLGPYRQAPAERGGDWWLVNPFTGSEPWRALEFANGPAKAALETEPPPEDFVRIFGPRPETRTASAQWEQDLSYFQGTGLPDGFDEAQLEAATAEFESWGLGKPVFYEGRYGWQVRFPDSQLPTFETTASTALLVPHIVIAEHQVRSIQEGLSPSRYHPWLPERLRA